ncbi:MAG: ATPase/protein kinase family protein [Myxococcaceae bacterium]|nr:ATPase/protein kinase family protein [Myxococcaceae bacterium]
MRGAGQSIAGAHRFDLRGLLGDGGGGVVYRAFDRALGHEVALKLMHRREGDELTRFRQSFPQLKRLAHPSLVQLYDLVEERGQVLLVMELIEGVDLLRFVRRGTRSFDELRVRAAFGQLAQALQALHQERKIHRDVKPPNVRVTPQGRVVLLDLDLAIDLDAERSERALGLHLRPVGTAMYMAPEQAAGLRLGTASDWYSMGVVLYEALTGVRPFSGTDLEVLLEKQECKPVPPRDLVPDLPADLERLCVDLLASDPHDRPTGAEILRRLHVNEDVLSARWTSASLLSTRPAFVGRASELARIEAAFERSRHAAVVVRVTGEPGVGKTSLCDEAVRRLKQREPRLLALRGACSRYPDKSHAPLHEPIARLAEALREGRSSVRLSVSASALRLLEHAFPGAVVGLEAKNHGRTALAPEPLEQRWRAIGTLRAILAEAAALRPIVLQLDDYHWADVDTQRFVSSLVAGPDAPRFLLLLSEEPEPGLVHASEPCANETLELRNLSRDESALLIEELLERAGDGYRELEPSLVRFSQHHDSVRTDCSPLLVQERVRQAILFEHVPRSERALDGDLTSMLTRRVAGLCEPALRILQLVCAAFDALPQAVCERAADLLPAEFTRHVASLSIAGLLRSIELQGEDGLIATHALVAEFVDLALQGPRRVLIHQRLASALMARDAAPASGRLLRHQGESGDHARAAESAQLAAEQAYGALAFQRAAELFTLSASLRPPTQNEQGHRLLRRMAEALAHAGWVLSAATIYREAAPFASAAESLHMHQRSFECFLRGAEVEEGLRVMDELLSSLGVKRALSTSHALWSLHAQRVRMRLRGHGFRVRRASQVAASELRKVDVLFVSGAQLMRVDAAQGAALLAQAWAAARTVGEPQRIARALCTEAWSFVGRGTTDPRRALGLLETARALTERHNAPELDGHLRLAQGMLALSAYQVRECSTHCRDASRVFRDSCVDVTWELSMAQVHQLLALSFMSHYREAAPTLQLYKRESEERGDMWTYTALLGVEALGTCLADDAVELAEARLCEAASRWSPRDTLNTQSVLRLLGSSALDLYRRTEHAEQRFESRMEELDLRQLRRLPFERIALLELGARTRLLAAALRPSPAAFRAVEADVVRLLHEHEPAASGFAHLLLGNLHFARGDRARSLKLLEQGIAELDPLGLGQWVAPARLALGRLCGGTRGYAMEESARAQLKQRGVARPERFAAMMLPSFRLD